MGEAGFDLVGAPTTKLATELAHGAKILISMGCGDQCPVVPGVKRDDWPLEDPKRKPIEAAERSATRIALAFRRWSRNRTGRDADRFT